MPSIDELDAPRAGIPYLDGCIGASRSDALSAGGPGYADHRIAMPFVCEQDRTYGAFIPTGIPYAYKVVATSGGYSFTIRRPGDAKHVFSMPAGKQCLTGNGAPHLQYTRRTCDIAGSDTPSIGRPGYGIHLKIWLAVVGQQGGSYPGRGIFKGGGRGRLRDGPRRRISGVGACFQPAYGAASNE